MLELTILTVPDCPNEPVLRDRLAQVLAGHPDATVTRRVIQDDAGAARYGMHGSPTCCRAPKMPMKASLKVPMSWCGKAPPAGLLAGLCERGAAPGCHGAGLVVGDLSGCSPGCFFVD